MKNTYLKNGIICLCIMMLFCISGCTVSINTDTNDPQLHEIPQLNLEYHNIVVVPPVSARETAMERGELEEFEANLHAAQEYFDTTKLDLSIPTLYFVPLRGDYMQNTQEMFLFGAFVNRHENPILSFSSRVRVQTDIADMEIATMTLDFPQDFIGILQTNEALVMSLTVPVRGLEEDRTFEAYQFISEMSDITLVELDVTP